MDDKRKDFEGISDLDDINERYRHYLEIDSEEDEVESKNDAVKPQYEDISSFTEGNEDFYSSSSEDEEEDEAPEQRVEAPKPEGNFFTRNRYRNTKITALIVVIALLLGAGGFLVYIWWSTRSEGYNKDGVEYNELDESDYLSDEQTNFEAMGDVDGDSLNEWLKAWAKNGEKMYNKNVINVLLCGVDSRDGTASKARSDSMILISVNKKTEKITMVSLLRDSWTYMDVPRENGTSYDYYFKLNAAYSLGGPATLIETLENNFKIEIDQYIAVDFTSFPKLIDALGGVTVDVQEYEAKYIRRTSSYKNFPSGKSKLNGKQTLIYSRIRKSDGDSDVSRTRRQRSVIKGLIASAKTATKGQLLNAFKQVSGYMRTGYSQSEVLSLIATAYSHDWMDFEMVELMLPNEDYVDRFSTYIGSQSCWVVDFALCAQKLQKALYGESNIFLSDDRTSALDFVTRHKKDPSTSSTYSGSYGSSSSGSSGSSSSDSSRTHSYGNDGDEEEESTKKPDTDVTDSNEEPTQRTHFTLPTRPTRPHEPEPEPDPVVDPEPQENESEE